MGKRGPPKKPTKLKLLQGNPSNTPENKNEPKPKRARNPQPVFPLSERGKKIWKKLFKVLNPLGLFTEADVWTLTKYAEIFDRWLSCKEFLDQNGYAYPIRSEKGEVKAMGQYPEVSMYKELITKMHRIEQEFGLTPAARSTLNPNSKDVDDAFTKKLFG